MFTRAGWSALLVEILWLQLSIIGKLLFPRRDELEAPATCQVRKTLSGVHDGP